MKPPLQTQTIGLCVTTSHSHSPASIELRKRTKHSTAFQTKQKIHTAMGSGSQQVDCSASATETPRKGNDSTITPSSFSVDRYSRMLALTLRSLRHAKNYVRNWRQQRQHCTPLKIGLARLQAPNLRLSWNT